MTSAPVPPRAGESNENRHGFRNPKLQISGSVPAGPLDTNGFEAGTA